VGTPEGRSLISTQQLPLPGHVGEAVAVIQQK